MPKRKDVAIPLGIVRNEDLTHTYTTRCARIVTLCSPVIAMAGKRYFNRKAKANERLTWLGCISTIPSLVPLVPSGKNYNSDIVLLSTNTPVDPGAEPD